jgi:biotin transport system substrate-specific component
MPVNENVKNSYILNIISKLRSNTLFLVTIFALLTAAAAQISIPVKPVPFTLQTMMVVLAGAFLGARAGAYSQLLYLALGIIGLPVFAQTADMSYGIARIFGPTGGYLLSFPLAAFVTGLIIEKYKSYLMVALSMFLGNLLIILSGVLYLNMFINDFNEALKAGAVIFSVWTVVKVLASTAIYFSVRKRNS